MMKAMWFFVLNADYSNFNGPKKVIWPYRDNVACNVGGKMGFFNEHIGIR